LPALEDREGGWCEGWEMRIGEARMRDVGRIVELNSALSGRIVELNSALFQEDASARDAFTNLE
jgi:hypothetical protein